MAEAPFAAGDRVAYHGREYAVTKVEPWGDPDDAGSCHELTLERQEEHCSVVTWVDACAVRRVAEDTSDGEPD